MKWSLLLTVILSSSGVVMVSLLAIYWRRKKRIISSIDTPVVLPVLDISEYKVIVIEEETECEEYFSKRLRCREKVEFVGLDCEWISPNFHQELSSTNGDQRPAAVALLQLAFIDKECVLVRLSKIGKITQSLKLLLNDKSCLKFGVGVLSDGVRLTREYSDIIATVGCIDLRNVSVRCGIRNNISLAGLTQQLTGQSLIKSMELTCSNWEQTQLTNDQIMYAARDAIAGLVIFERLVSRKMTQRRKDITVDILSQEEKCSNVGSSVLSSEEGKLCAHSLCQGLIDFGFKESTIKQPSKSTPHQSMLVPGRTAAYNIRQSPLYHNCQLIAPDGTLLSTVDIKKVEWYLSKGLGVLESEDPPVLRLSFEPSGKPNKDREYYLTEKENICVVCGRSDSYIRKNVVPHEYRKHFPSKMKEHMSHDVVLLCVNCHQISSHYDGSFRLQIASEYSAPLEASTQKFHEDSYKVKLRSLARALTSDRSAGKLPEGRRHEIMETIADHFKCQPNEVSDEMIEELTTIETKQQNINYISHGEMVVRSVSEREELVEFQQRWRQHFLDTMQPRYMPKLWSVYHNPSS